MNTKLLLLFVAGIVATEGVDVPTNFTCYPNATIEVVNPNATIYTEIFSNQLSDFTTCTVSMAGNGDVTITGCSLDEDILVHFTSRSIDPSTDQILGGIATINYIIQCEELDILGVTVSEDTVLGITLVTESPVSSKPTYSIVSVLKSGATTVSRASVGEVLTWEITIPAEYYLTVTSCWAYAGTDTTTGTNKQIIVAGCTQDDSLVEDFGNGTTSVYSKIYSTSLSVFKFYNNDDVFLECDLKLCPDTNNCYQGCNPGKKRRALDEDDTSMYAKTTYQLHVLNSLLRGSASRPAPVFVAFCACLMFVILS